MKTFAFVDASNLFYGGEKSLGWKIDYRKLLLYLKEKYVASEVFYFGGVEIHDFPYNYQTDEARILLIGRHLQRVRFYLKLEQFGYKLFLKPVKLYEQEGGTTKRKANCDVDMAFHLMKEKDNFDRVIILSGDGDFLPVLKYLKQISKQVLVLARGKRTAKEIKQFSGDKFLDFTRLQHKLSFEDK